MKTQYLLHNMSGKISFTGEPVKAVAYDILNTNKRTSTIAIYTLKFTGRIWLQGSLKDNPKEDLDWFNIPLTKCKPYLEYDNISNPMSIRENTYHNINGSFIWLRAKMDRDYLNCNTSPFEPYDYVSKQYIIDANVDMNQGFSHSNYPKTPLNPKDDPVYCKDWKPDFRRDYDRDVLARQWGNIEKITLCY